MGGYGTYNIDNPSSRVLKPPGGGNSFNIFSHEEGGSDRGIGHQQPQPQYDQLDVAMQQQQQQRRQQNIVAHGGKAALENMGGYGTYDVDKPR